MTQVPDWIPTGLPQSVVERVELPPATQLFLVILREAFPDIEVTPRIPQAALTGVWEPTRNPMILVRQGASVGGNTADGRFIAQVTMEIHCFTTDPDGERKAALVSEAVRVALRDAWLEHRSIPGLGAVIRIDMTNEPARKSDWATSAGPVQYADLPNGAWRFETTYRFTYRRETS